MPRQGTHGCWRVVHGAAALVLISLLGVPQAAHAYVDPSAGSILIQLILGGVAGVVVLLKVFYRKIVGRFTGARTEIDAGSTGERQRRE